MKILLATFWAVPHTGGVWNYMLQLKAKLESYGNEVDLLGYGEGNKFIHIVNENRRIEEKDLIPRINAQLKNRNRWALYIEQEYYLKYYEYYRCFFEIGATQFGLEKYDLIHTQDVLSTTCIKRVKPLGTPLVASIHGCVAHEIKHAVTKNHKTPTAHLVTSYFDILEHDGATAADVTIVANKWLKNILTGEFFVPEQQIKIHHYGYDTATFLNRMNERSSIQRPANKKVIIYAGRLTELKGIHHLLEALAQLQKKRNDWICWIVGDGEKQDELQAQSKRLGLEKDVLFLGKRNDIPSLLSISDIFVLPSLIENQPLSVIEAQISGKVAVIVSDAGGLPEMVEHGITGVITPAANPSMLSININYLLEHEPYRENLGIRAQKWGLEHWSMDNAFINIMNIYQRAVIKKKFLD
jgi:glycosyltransferase involved in cell wall biosynthesis